MVISIIKRLIPTRRRMYFSRSDADSLPYVGITFVWFKGKFVVVPRASLNESSGNGWGGQH